MVNSAYRSRLARVLSAGLMLALSLFPGVSAAPVHAIACAFFNPLLEFGQDPSVVYQDGYYYLVQSTANGLTIAKSETLTGLGRVEPALVYVPPANQPYSYDLWAPELIYLDGQWYIYVAATDSPGNNPSHRMYVLQADSDDPLGSWTMQNKVYDAHADRWAIDGIVFEYQGQLYMVWSGWETEKGDFPQNLYIAEMSDPLTLAGPRHLLSEPDQAWERSVAAIQEGPQVFMYDSQLSIVYSADASWMPAYKLGLLTLTGSDPLDPASWTKTGPIFEQVLAGDAPVYGPGHNSNPVLSPSGEEWWFLYHAKTESVPGWNDRSIRAQEFTWSPDGTPVLGEPVPTSEALPIPSGEPCGLVVEFEEIELSANDSAGFVDTGQAWLPTQGSFSVAAEVKLRETDGPYAFVSQEGGITSNFVVGYADDRFVFTMYDGLGRSSVSAVAASAPEVDMWYHLTGVFDAGNDQVLLYVDGELHGTATFEEPWESLGHTIVGAARQRSQRVDIFDGEIRDITLFNGALEPVEVQALMEMAAQASSPR